MAAVFIGARVEQTGVLGTMVHASAGKGGPFECKGHTSKGSETGNCGGGGEAMANRHPRNRLCWNKGRYDLDVVSRCRRQSTVFSIPRLPYSVKLLLGRDEKERRTEDGQKGPLIRRGSCSDPRSKKEAERLRRRAEGIIFDCSVALCPFVKGLLVDRW